MFQTEEKSTVKHQHVKQTVLPTTSTEQNKTVRRKLQKVFKLFGKVFKIENMFCETPVANFGSPKFFLLGIRFVSSFHEESQLLANCNWEDSMFACNHLLGVSAKHIQKPKALHHAIIHSGSSFRTSICLTCWIRGCVSTSPI